ncbi:MAG: hypothetical protein MH204_02420 [Fimbriimonadaceae bacterium]|nr:hypothetical protein [Fimbriimonadaceae bacterium]
MKIGVSMAVIAVVAALIVVVGGVGILRLGDVLRDFESRKLSSVRATAEFTAKSS